jgi:hypothetical protein
VLLTSLFILGTIAQAAVSVVTYFYIHTILKQHKFQRTFIYIPAIPINVPCGKCGCIHYPNYYVTTGPKKEQVLCTTCLLKSAQHLAMQL